jgi:hypothetical protein
MEQQLQQSKDIARLMDIGVLEKDYSFEWTFMLPKFLIHKENLKIRALTNNWNLNILLKRHTFFPIPKIGKAA